MSDAALTPEELALLPHDDRGPAILASHWLLTALATAFLVLRIYCKRSTNRKLWWDDRILLAAWVTIIVSASITTVLVEEFKLGRHSWDLHLDPATNLSKFILLLSSRATFSITALGWTKTAFAITLLRLTDGMTRSFVWFIIISLNITTIVSALVPWIQCSPLEKWWNPMLDGTCWANQVGTKVWIGMGAYSALMDFTLAILPWTFLYAMSLRRKEKFGILVAMSMGAVAGGVAIGKCAKLPQLGSGDSFNEVELYIWDITESTVTMMAACIPTLRVLIYRNATTKQGSSTEGTSSTRHRYNMSDIIRESGPMDRHPASVRVERDVSFDAPIPRDRTGGERGFGHEDEEKRGYFDLRHQKSGSSQDPVLGPGTTWIQMSSSSSGSVGLQDESTPGSGLQTRYDYPSN